VGVAETLRDKKSGFEGPLVDFQGPVVLQSRLMELGFVRGEVLRVEGRTPFQDVIVSVRGTEICLRPQEAECLLV
jgi:Fe2+ transport system protein FeoA